MKCVFVCGACGLRNEFDPEARVRERDELILRAYGQGPSAADAMATARGGDSFRLRCVCGVLNDVNMPAPVAGVFLKDAGGEPGQDEPREGPRAGVGRQEKTTSPPDSTYHTFSNAAPAEMSCQPSCNRSHTFLWFSGLFGGWALTAALVTLGRACGVLP